jgi:hypothetical protein
MARPRVFVCHSHQDRRWADRVLAYLPALSRGYEIVLYDDVSSAGEDWRGETEAALMQASVVILLVSPDFLASRFLTEIKISRLLLIRAGPDVVTIPLIIRPTDWQQVSWLQQRQVLPSAGTPMSKLPPDRVDAELSHLAERVREAIAQVQSRQHRDKGPDAAPAVLNVEVSPARETPWVFISHAHADGDFAELLKKAVEEAGFRAWIDADRLPVGFDWREGIDEAVRKSVAIVAVISPRSAISEYVTYEWAFAYGAGIRVIPVVIEPTKMHPRLDVLQHLDFTNRRGRPWEALITALRDAAEKKNGSNQR